VPRSDFWLLHPLRVRFNEVDRQGIAHNSVHLVYFGIGLNEYFRNLDYDRFGEEARNGTGMHVVQANVTYKAPIRLDEEIEVGARITRIGRSSATFGYEIYRVGSGELLASGSQVWVNTHRESHRPTPWPDSFRAAVRARETQLEEAAA
jgi:acyl-CoA thioester hydrolase